MKIFLRNSRNSGISREMYIINIAYHIVLPHCVTKLRELLLDKYLDTKSFLGKIVVVPSRHITFN